MNISQKGFRAIEGLLFLYSGFSKGHEGELWLVGCFGFNGLLRQYFSLYRAVSQREGERKEK